MHNQALHHMTALQNPAVWLYLPDFLNFRKAKTRCIGQGGFGIELC